MRTRSALPLVAAVMVTLAACSGHHSTSAAPVSPGSVTSQPTSASGSATPPPTSAPTRSSSAAPSIIAPSDDPLSGLSLWVDPNSPAAAEVQRRRSGGDRADATALQAIAGQPTARWLGSWAALDGVPSVLASAASSGSTPVFVAYFIPDRDCGGQSSGGADSDGKYRDWIGTLAARLGDASAIVILEPDAIPMASPGGCANGEYHHRTALLSAAVTKLKSHPGVRVYLDAGHPAWPSDPSVSVQPLEDSGLAQADGFALNTSNFQVLADDLAYGNALSALVGGKHFVVDTGRNGNGPLPANSGYAGPVWCNPPGRALGATPTTDTGDAQADAFLWIKYPGESDGDCGLHDPAAGTWLAGYALALVHNRH